MKKLLFVLEVLAIGFAQADNIVTSREYVDAQVNALQSELPAKNTDAVLVYTGVAGEIDEKKIYNSAEIYNEQPDALVTAGVFNTAMQNALASEFVCVERQNGNGGCLLYEVRGAVPQRVLPSGYTQLEYLESTGTQYIDTGTVPTTNTNFEIKLQYTNINDTQGMIGYLDNTEPPTNFYLVKSRLTTDVLFASGTVAQRLATISPSVGTLYTYKLTGNSLYINNEVLDVQRGTLSTSNTMYIFSRNNSDLKAGLRAKVYYYKIYNNTSLVRNFIPARRDSDGALGMYDLVSGGFFMNSGSGDFIAGPDANYLLQ